VAFSELLGRQCGSTIRVLGPQYPERAFRGLGLQASVTGPITKPRDQPDRALLLVKADQPAHLARGQPQPRSDRMLLELSVDKSLNALEPIQFAHSSLSPWVSGSWRISQTAKTVNGEWITGTKADISIWVSHVTVG
jgi:hypothetical protein